MNDDELIITLREQLGSMPMTTPVEQIIRRGHALRTRRRVPGVAAGLSAVGAAAFAVSTGLPASLPAAGQAGSHPAAGHAGAGHASASHTASVPGLKLAAWTVTREANGDIKVTFRQARDPAGLQRTLRADGIPASVTLAGQQNPACRPYSSSAGPAYWPFGSATGPLGGSSFLKQPKEAFEHPQDILIIRPAALPSGVGLQVAVMQGLPPGPAGPWPYPKGSGHPVVEVSLVRASSQCTGS